MASGSGSSGSLADRRQQWRFGP